MRSMISPSPTGGVVTSEVLASMSTMVRAPRRTASLTPKLSMTPPSMSRRSRSGTGGSTVGMALDARTAGATGPRWK